MHAGRNVGHSGCFARSDAVLNESGLAKADVLKGIRYLQADAELFETFGKNTDGILWTEIPTFETASLSSRRMCGAARPGIGGGRQKSHSVA